MSLARLDEVLRRETAALEEAGTAKGAEDVTVGVIAPGGGLGPRYLLAGHGDKPFLKMNSNSYLGMSLRPEVIAAEEEATRAFGAGPGAVRFISGTFQAHVDLEAKLAAFHAREAAMAFSSAYATVMGVVSSLITPETAVVSDALNHNCIINAVRLSRPAAKAIYPHLDMDALSGRLAEAAAAGHRRALVITDGVFSMRGDYADLAAVVAAARAHDEAFPEGVIVVVDDSHGVGAYGATGRGTEELAGARADVLVATLGKAFGVNGGYVVSSPAVVRYLREKAPFYIYSNPITPGEAAAAMRAVELLDGPGGAALLEHLGAMTRRFEQGLVALGYETIPGPHPVVPLMVRDTERTAALVAFLKDEGILVTGLNYPVVPKGDESIRFQISADHTEADIDQALDALRRFAG